MNGLSDMGLGTFTLFVACLWHHHGDMGCCVCGRDGSLRFTVSFHGAQITIGTIGISGQLI